jgi:hypothetical protein
MKSTIQIYKTQGFASDALLKSEFSIMVVGNLELNDLTFNQIVELREVLSKVIDYEKNIKHCLQGDSNIWWQIQGIRHSWCLRYSAH